MLAFRVRMFVPACHSCLLSFQIVARASRPYVTRLAAFSRVLRLDFACRARVLDLDLVVIVADGSQLHVNARGFAHSIDTAVRVVVSTCFGTLTIIVCTDSLAHPGC
jgi:hypothetical protein